MTRASGTEVKIISVQPLPVVFVRLPDWILLVCYISKGLHGIHLHSDLFFPALVPKEIPSGEDDGSTPWPPVSESTSKRMGGKQPPSSAKHLFVSLSPPNPPSNFPHLWSHWLFTQWAPSVGMCWGFFFNLAWMMVPSHPAAHILLRPLLLPRLASFLTSGHNTRPQLCCRDINISARLLSFFAGGGADSTIRYMKAPRTIKARVEILCYVFYWPSRLFSCHIIFDRRRRFCVWSHCSILPETLAGRQLEISYYTRLTVAQIYTSISIPSLMLFIIDGSTFIAAESRVTLTWFSFSSKACLQTRPGNQQRLKMLLFSRWMAAF